MSISEIKKNAKDFLKNNYGRVLALCILYIASFLAINWAIDTISSFVEEVSEIISFVLTSLVIIPISYGFNKLLINIKNGEKVNVLNVFTIGFKEFGRVISTWWSSFWRKLLKTLPGKIIMGIGITFMFVYLIYVILISIVTNESFQNELQNSLGDDYYTVVSSCYNIVENISPYAKTFELMKYLGIGLLIIGYIITLPFELQYIIYQIIAVDRMDLDAKQVAKETVKLMNGNRLKYIGLMLSFVGWDILCIFTCGIGFIFLIPYIQTSKICFYESLKPKETLITDTNVIEEK